MSKQEIVVTKDEITDALVGLSNKDIKKAYQAAIKKGLRIVQKYTIKNLRQHHRSKDLEKGVKIKAGKSGDEGKIHIMGDYRLKWFEKGTKKRYTKKGYYRGEIAAEGFFDEARRSTETQVFDSLEKDISTELVKRWRKKK